ncbi:hypothetical protein [Cupriavidus basilensis]|uniref:hypothetical protein n=1 Tax=Cupriavidus basilensis TaxID=68895 RepID=UPI0039F6795E
MNSSKEQASDNQFQSLLDAVERLREEKFPQLDATLVRELLRLHSDVTAEDRDLARGVEQAVEHHIPKEA